MPWVPTSEKNADRNALRPGPLPSSIRWWNSLISMPMKPRPNRPVIASQISTLAELRLSVPIMAMP